VLILLVTGCSVQTIPLDQIIARMPTVPTVEPQTTPAVPDPSLLFEAIEANDHEALRQLLDAGVDVHAQDANGITALMVAVESGDVESVQVLLDAGADVNAQDARGNTALMLAKESNVVQSLLNAGARTGE
jgi:hypothetical protein